MKILFVIDKLNTGGVSSSLLNLLKEISSKAECDLLIFSGKKIESNKSLEKVKILKTPRILSVLGMTQKETFNNSFLLGIFRILLVVVSKVFSGVVGRKILFNFVKVIKGYDVVVSYTHDVGWRNLTTGCNQFVIDRVDAKQKVSFVHCDYNSFGGYDPKQLNTYQKFNYIVCVSEACRKNFVECFPSLNSISRVIENFTDFEKIKKMTSSAHEYDSNICNIVTVCRLAEEKGIARTLDALSRMVKDGVKDFKWIIVGDGPSYDSLEKKVEKLGLKEYVEFVGESKNPFYYMKNATVFLLPSLHEAAPMVFGECKALKLPILTTDTISARELVESRGAGWVCANNEEGIFYALKDIITNRAILLQNIKTVNSDNINANAFRQLDSLILDLHNGTVNWR